MSNTSPTPKQEEVLSFIRDFKKTHDVPPSLREISSGLGVSVGTIQGHLRLLQNKGLLSWVPEKKRSLRLVESTNLQPTVPLPLLGIISAGEGIVVYEEADPEIIQVPKNMISFGFNHYCLRISGESMIDEGILNNDIVLIRQQTDANPGDIVVAILNGNFEEKATIKKYWPRDDKIELRPRNPNKNPITVSPEEIEIRGKFCGLIRKELN